MKEIIDKMDNELPDDFCINHIVARDQRANEVSRGVGHAGTMGYENIGCFECKGYDNNCRYYNPNLVRD